MYDPGMIARSKHEQEDCSLSDRLRVQTERQWRGPQKPRGVIVTWRTVFQVGAHNPYVCDFDLRFAFGLQHCGTTWRARHGAVTKRHEYHNLFDFNQSDHFSHCYAKTFDGEAAIIVTGARNFTACGRISAVAATALGLQRYGRYGLLGHDPEKWIPVFRNAVLNATPQKPRE